MILCDKLTFTMMTFNKPYIQKRFDNEEDAWDAAKLFGGTVYCSGGVDKPFYFKWFNGVSCNEAIVKDGKIVSDKEEPGMWEM